MTLKQHVVVSAASGVALGFGLSSFSAAAACVLVGVFVDLDHYLDFWMNRGFRLNPREFFDFCYYGTSPTFVALLHGWEYVPLLAGATVMSAWRPELVGALVGYALHLLGDQLFNRHLHRWTYFISYRIYHGFDSGSIVLSNPFSRGRTEV
jgi:membrane-bound metal-dependent hydrolase YbcI (DUF457 family)